MAGFYESRADRLDAIRARLLSSEEIAWEVDVARGPEAPSPNVVGHVHLQRVLIVRALLAARAGEVEDALSWMEASWRLNATLTSRPEMMAHMIAASVARLQAGALRKIDSPAMEWADRLRSPEPLAAFIASIHNETWFLSNSGDPPEGEYRPGAVVHGFLAALKTDDLCAWNAEGLVRLAAQAAEGESQTNRILAQISLPDVLDRLGRWPRSRLEAELTALVLDARAERAGSRRNAWPDRLFNLESGVCPGQRWSYRVNRDNTATIAWEGKVPGFATTLKLPLAFTAGTPVPRRDERSKTGRNQVR